MSDTENSPSQALLSGGDGGLSDYANSKKWVTHAKSQPRTRHRPRGWPRNARLGSKPDPNEPENFYAEYDRQMKAREAERCSPS